MAVATAKVTLPIRFKGSLKVRPLLPPTEMVMLLAPIPAVLLPRSILVTPEIVRLPVVDNPVSKLNLPAEEVVKSISPSVLLAVTALICPCMVISPPVVRKSIVGKVEISLL